MFRDSGEVDSHPSAPAARRSGARVLLAQAGATVLIQSSLAAVTAILPVLARLRFGAGDWQTFLVTVATSTLAIFSIFWNAYLARSSTRSYLLTYWLVALLPLGLVSLASGYWTLLLFYVLAAIGASGWTPVFGQLLKRLYSDERRGRALSVINSASLAGTMVGSFAVGAWLHADANAFRIYMPAAAVLQLAGIGLLILLAQRTRPTPAPSAAVPQRPPRLRDLLAPIAHMNQVLRADRAFLRYEAAFMTYGVGWMICFALLPVLLTEKLAMNYQEVANSTQVVFQLAMLLTTIPIGWFADRFGVAHTSAASFAGLVLYPLGLLLARNTLEVALISTWYGVMMSGVNLAWMLGPVRFAPSPALVPQYVAIHTSLVGLRGILFQGLAMLIYTLTHSFVWPLLLASAAFGWASFQMRRLHATLQQPTVASGAPIDALPGARATLQRPASLPGDPGSAPVVLGADVAT